MPSNRWLAQSAGMATVWMLVGAGICLVAALLSTKSLVPSLIVAITLMAEGLMLALKWFLDYLRDEASLTYGVFAWITIIALLFGPITGVMLFIGNGCRIYP